MRLSTLLLALLLGAPAWAGQLELDGHFLQGGLVFGATEPGAEVMLDGRRVRVSPAGRFLLGFGREAGPAASLTIRFSDGTRETRRLEIEQRSYKIQRINGLSRKMVTPPESEWPRIQAENARIAEVRALDRPEAMFESGFTWPALGRISGVYGSQRILNGEPRRPHYGVDVAAPLGTPITAPADGVVALAETGMYYTGGTVILDHGHGLTSAFLHMKDVLVTVDMRVKQGELIGTLGATGRVTGPHLDWRINWFDQRLDPGLLVGPMPEAGG
jgi:murein DD-endopeptidase MepM/ murein hydrolase activator NlpD